MLHKTRGIVFRYVKYRESSIIATVYTEHFGVQGYIVNGIRSKKSKGRMALFQALTLLDLVVYHKENRSLHRLSEVKCHLPFHSIPIDLKKSTIAFFLTEILNKSVREEVQDAELFEFLFHSLQVLDNLDRGYENFHLQFLLKLSRYLGFGAEAALEDTVPFSPGSGVEEKKLLQALSSGGYGMTLKIGNGTRQALLHQILTFYAGHIDAFRHIKSLKVLSELLH